MCRNCYLRRKTGQVQFLLAVITSAMIAIHAWQFKCQLCQAMTLTLQILPKLQPWQLFLTLLLRKATGTPITSHWDGNAIVVTTSSTRNYKFVKWPSYFFCWLNFNICGLGVSQGNRFAYVSMDPIHQSLIHLYRVCYRPHEFQLYSVAS